jgi:glucokinase
VPKLKLIGVDLGGTTFSVGLVSEDGKILKKVTRDTLVENGKEDVIRRIAETILEVSDGEETPYVGIGSPGSIDRENGIVRFSPNFPDWHNVPLTDELAKRTGKKVFLENDANAFVLGEKWFGAGRGYDHIVALTLGTGIGGGVVTHGYLLTGRDGIGAELGHVVVEPNGPMCNCGTRGCLEAVASATAIRRFLREGYKKYHSSLVYKLAGSPEKADAKHLFDAARQGDRFALMIRDRVVDALARAVAGYIHIFNPEIVIIGGGISRAGEILFGPLREKVVDYIMPSFVGTYEIVASPLVEDAGILGAASIIKERIGG